MKAAVVACGLWFVACAAAPVLAAASGEGEVREQQLASAAEAERRGDPHRALELYLEVARTGPEQAWVLQKVAQQMSDAAILDGGGAKQRVRLLEALGYARRAVELAPESAVNQLSLAILYGRLAGSGKASERLDYVRLIRTHAERALELDPHYAWAHHVLARWHIEVASIGAAKRALAAVVFGGLPKASREEALNLLQRAVELEPEALVHRVELGYAYEELGSIEEARAQWLQSLEMENKAVYDEAARARAREGLARTRR